jgi:drug/metabolite transporter (DMT)-like permease
VHAPDAPPADRLPHRPLIDPVVLGTLCGLASALIYTAANSFLRSVNDCDPVWVSAIKAVPTVVLMSPWLLTLVARGQKVLPAWPITLMIAAAGLFGQVVGNTSFQWALGEVGVALTVPLSLGGMIVSAAILGRVFLHEPVTPRAALSLAILLLAIGVLSLGASDARVSVVKAAAAPLEVAAGVAAGCLAGFAYSVLNVAIRYAVLRGMPLPTTLFIVAAGGLVSLATIAWTRIGLAGMLATAPHDLVLMLLAGVCNTLAFLALTKSLQLTSVVYVNALNATQAALAALAGVVIFQEALSAWLLQGVVLTIVGLAILTRARPTLRPQQPA